MIEQATSVPDSGRASGHIPIDLFIQSFYLEDVVQDPCSIIFEIG